MKFAIAAITIAAMLGPVSAHSWVEELQAISDNGSYTGDYGYTRGYVARTDPGFTGDSMDYLLPPLSSGRLRIDNTDLLCHPDQRTSNYANTAYPRLNISPGGYIAMKYLENGHVTLPENQKGKPKSGGPVFVFGTTSPSDTEKIADVLKWTADGSGGDKRGFLITSNNFDDGRCHQINSGAISTERQQQFPDRVVGQATSNVEQWCETDIQVPASQKAGDKLTLYWIWQWPTAPGGDPIYPEGKDEYYTSCAEVQIVDGSDMTADSKVKAAHTLVQQDPQTVAVESYKSRSAIITSPLVTLASASGSASASDSSAPASSSSMSASSSASSSAVPSSSYAAPPSSSATSTSTSTSSTPASSHHGRPSYPQGPPSQHPAPTNNPMSPPNTVTVTDYITLSTASDFEQKVQGTKTQTQWVTSYVTAVPSIVFKNNTAVVSAPAAAAGLVGVKFRY